MPVTVDTSQDEVVLVYMVVLKLDFGLAPLTHPRGPCMPSRSPKFKYGYYLREAEEKRSAPRLTPPFPKAARDTACDLVASKRALQSLHAHKRRAANHA